MTDIGALDDYLLVKDKDGRMKYYKDGQFFGVEEIEQKKKQEQLKREQLSQKKILKPIYTMETARVAAAPRVQPPTPVAPTRPVEPSPKVEPVKKVVSVVKIAPPLSPRPDLDHESLAVNGAARQQREEDQKLIDGRVDQVIEKLKIKFSDEAIRVRFRSMLLTYFRGIRTIKELGYMLSLPKTSGGMELPKDKIVLVVSVLEHEAEELNKHRRQLAIKSKDNFAVVSVADIEHRLAPPPPVIVARPAEKIVPPKPIPAAKQTLAAAPFRPAALSVRPEIKRPRLNEVSAPNQNKPRMEDVKHDRRLIGPVEELGTMDLTNFRRLGRNVKEIFEEISEKFHILAEQSLLKKIEGINAWRRSPVYALYLSMIMEGVREKKTIDQVIENRQFKNSVVLTLSEYESIAKLNQTLNA